MAGIQENNDWRCSVREEHPINWKSEIGGLGAEEGFYPHSPWVNSLSPWRDLRYAPASGMSHQQHYFSRTNSYLHSIINAISLLNLLSAVKYLKLKVSSPTRSFRLHSILSSVVTNRRYEAWVLQGSIFRLPLPNWPFYIRFSIVFPEAFL